jgi:hypothetical protein
MWWWTKHGLRALCVWRGAVEHELPGGGSADAPRELGSAGSSSAEPAAAP